MAGPNLKFNPFYAAILMAMSSHPNLEEDLDTITNILTGVRTSLKSMQNGVEAFHATMRSAANARNSSTAAPKPPVEEKAIVPVNTEKEQQNVKHTSESLNENLKNLELLLARINNSNRNPT